MTKKIDFERDSIAQHRKMLEDPYFTARVIDDKRKKKPHKRMSIRELHNEFEQTGERFPDE